MATQEPISTLSNEIKLEISLANPSTQFK